MLTKLLRNISQRNDIILAFLLICIVFMMILPLPTVLVDILIGINLTMSAILLMVAIYLADVVAFSAFPAILLLTTLFRLALSITTTRLILLDADAGQIVETFGKFVVSGNLIVGGVIFLILTIVNFMVITKGAERVAEVAARFSLDAMPGKQMSIDSDMRAGQIDMNDAKARRGKLEKESQLYGAMDGAMKFVNPPLEQHQTRMFQSGRTLLQGATQMPPLPDVRNVPTRSRCLNHNSQGSEPASCSKRKKGVAQGQSHNRHPMIVPSDMPPIGSSSFRPSMTAWLKEPPWRDSKWSIRPLCRISRSKPAVCD